MKTPTEEMNCCGATNKEKCTKPPCPCNLDCYSPQELKFLRSKDKYAIFDKQARTLLPYFEGNQNV